MKTLHELAWSLPDNLIEEQLIDVAPVTGEYCYCAVGFLLHECGVTDDELMELDEQEQLDIQDYAGGILGLTSDQVEVIFSTNDRALDADWRQLEVKRVLLEMI